MRFGEFYANATAGIVGLALLLLVLGGCAVACDATGGIVQHMTKGAASRPADVDEDSRVDNDGDRSSQNLES